MSLRPEILAIVYTKSKRAFGDTWGILGTLIDTLVSPPGILMFCA